MAANKGEWGEPYVALKLLGDGKLYIADENDCRNPDEWMRILELIRHETKDRIVSYKYNENSTDINIDVNGRVVICLPISEFLRVSEMLYNDIIMARGRSFTVSDEVTEFLNKANITKLKAKSIDKNDIFLSVSDPRTSIVREHIGFSIKTKIGQNPSLFNTAKASGARYQLHNTNDSIMNEINSVFNAKGEVSVIDRCRIIKERNLEPTYCGFETAARAGCEAFRENLEVINPLLPNVIERILWYHFFEDMAEIEIKDISSRLINLNPCCISRPEIKYPYMIKSFLYAAYCGMTASTLWDGKSQVNGGFITVGNSGEILAYYALESEKFKNYLYNNCYLEFPSTSVKHGAYGKVYKDEGTNTYYFNLNFQIRYR